MFLSRHASNPDNLALLQAHLDSVCTGMLDKIVPLTRQQQMNTDLDDGNATHEPDDDLSIEHMRACREPPTHAPGPAIQTHPGGTLSGSPEEMLTGASFSRNKHPCVAAATPTPEVATSLPTDVGEVETTSDLTTRLTLTALPLCLAFAVSNPNKKRPAILIFLLYPHGAVT